MRWNLRVQALAQRIFRDEETQTRYHESLEFGEKPRLSLKQLVKSHSNIHRPGHNPDVFLFSLPRSGSTWLMELIWSQPGFKCCDEPTDLRNPYCRERLAMFSWESLYGDDAAKKLETYIRDLCDGRSSFLNPSPRRSYYRPLTDRLVLKILTGFEDKISWFHQTFNGKIVYLLRHPIAVSLSREYFPTLNALMNGSYRRYFTYDQLRFAEGILESGSKLQVGVLSWCIQNSVPLKELHDDSVLVSYEQMVLDPEPVISRLASVLELPNRERMMNQLAVPSGVKRKSDSETREILETAEVGSRRMLVDKWRSKVSDREERQAMEILRHFDLDLYQAGDLLPSPRVWICPGDSDLLRSPSEPSDCTDVPIALRPLEDRTADVLSRIDPHLEQRFDDKRPKAWWEIAAEMLDEFGHVD